MVCCVYFLFCFFSAANLLDQQVQELYSSTQSRCACGKCNETVSTGYRVSVAIMEGILITYVIFILICYVTRLYIYHTINVM